MANELVYIGTYDGDPDPAVTKNRECWRRVNAEVATERSLRSRTISAGDDRFIAGATSGARVQLAVAQALTELAELVTVPLFMLPFDITEVTSLAAFHATGGRLIREGGDSSVYDVWAYGAYGDGVNQDYASFAAAIAGAGIAQGRVIIPSNGSLRYLINDTLVLPANISIVGQAAGLSTPILRFNGGAKTMFQFVGATEAEPASIAFRDLQLESATNQVGIAIRLRNFADVFLSGVHVNHFRVGVKADWGQNLYISNGSKFVLNTRGIELGGDLSQTETPTPAAGIRTSPGTPFMDLVTVRDTQFSQCEIDINDMGSQQSLGILVVDGCRFYESAASPVTNKARFVTVTRRKGLRFTGNFIESPNANRVGVMLSAYDYESTFAAASYGFTIEGNYLLLTGTGGDPIYIEAAGGVIQANTIERPAGARHLSLMDSDLARPVTVGQNSYLQYADVEVAPVIRVSGGTVHNIFRSAGPLIKGLTYSASMTVDPAVADTFTVTATNGTAFAFVITAASLRVGYLTIQILNSAGGALGAGTFTGCTLTGGAWTQPANTFKRSITFFNNGTSYIEMARSGNDYA